ncbi:glycosyltransferase [Marinobacter daepoensis]|uniref:Glycosyltransferase n=1 Tax=Marinobacter daepoensis TaxID=262077 RepID=A0ABS3BAH4_9GAMM|nr:glycosyltransferase [Marinobacter daepoensis]MBN7768873.1 glycosyltransferase [Marinobacter daepoensis]MBY6077563.1 glycosyltransferase [Marinobacter daepoensis]
MKVLHLIDSGGLYGAEKMLLALARQQQRQGLSPTILSAGEPGMGDKPLEAEALRMGVSVKPWRMRPGFNLKGAREVLQWAQDNQFDLLHSHGYKFNVLMGLWPRALRRLPLITTLHGYVKAPRYTKSWLYELLDRRILPRMQQVVVVSDTMKGLIPQSLVASNSVSVIANGLATEVVLENSHAPVDQALNAFFSRHQKVVLGVGRLSREKGFDRLIHGFARIAQTDPSTGLLIVGEGAHRTVLEQLVSELNLEDKVFLPGYVANVSAVMAKASVLCLASHTEGLPITLLEGMNLGVPVVVSAVGDMPAVLGEGCGGTVLEDLSAKPLSEALSEAMAQGRKVKESTSWARERVQNSYSDTAMAENYLRVYRKVLS